MTGDREELEAALARLRAFQSEAEGIREELARKAALHAEAARTALERLGEARTDEDGIDHELIRSLYWHHPELHVKDIGRAGGVYAANQVWQYAGEPPTMTLSCYGCGKPGVFTYRPKNRTSLGKAAKLCEACAERNRKREEEYWRKRMAEDEDSEPDLRGELERLEDDLLELRRRIEGEG